MWTGRFFRALNVSALLASMASPANALQWKSAGGWDIVELDDGCALTQEFEGPGDTELYVVKNLDGTALVTMTNSNWTTREQDEFELTYALNGSAYSGAKSRGINLSGKSGFISKFGPDFLADFAKSGYLYVYRDKTVVDKLQLDGSAIALAQVNRCLAHLKAVAAADAREKARWKDIPTNPFGETVSTKAPGVPQPKFDKVASLFSAADYPAAAFAANQQGTVHFSLTVGADGRVLNCNIVGSSGSTSLDVGTCNVLRRRATFVPARTSGGTPTVGTYESFVNWRLEQDTSEKQ